MPVAPCLTGREQVAEPGVGEVLAVVRLVAGRGVGKPGEAGVNILATAFDQAVGAEHEDAALAEGRGSLGSEGVLRAGGQWGVGGPVQELDGPVRLDVGWWEVTGAAVGDGVGVPVEVCRGHGGVLGAVDGAGVQPQHLQGAGGAFGDEA